MPSVPTGNLVDRGVHEVGRIVHDPAFESAGQLRHDAGQRVAHPLDHAQEIGRGGDLDADEDGGLPVARHARLVAVRAESDLRHVAQAHIGAVHRLHHEIAEVLERMQIGGRGEGHLDHLALGVADRRDVVVARHGIRHVAGGDAVGLELVRVEPGAQREGLTADDLGGLHALQRLQLWLHHAGQVIRDLIGGQGVAGESQIHRIDGLADRDRDDRLQRPRRQLVQHGAHLDVDLRRRLRGVVVLPQVGRDGAGAALADRLHVVDAIRLRDRGFHRGGDETGDRVRIGTRKAGRDGDHAVLGLRIREHLERAERAHPHHQDHQAHHGGEYRATDEEIGELHGRRLIRWAESDAGRRSAARCCSRPPGSRCAA
jgi:hypothetical protein